MILAGYRKKKKKKSEGGDLGGHCQPGGAPEKLPLSRARAAPELAGVTVTGSPGDLVRYLAAAGALRARARPAFFRIRIFPLRFGELDGGSCIYI